MGGINGEGRDRQSWQHSPSPSVRSACSPHSKISLGERKAKYIIANDASPRVAECWASGERTGGIYGQDPGGKKKGGGGGVNANVKSLLHERQSDWFVCTCKHSRDRLEMAFEYFYRNVFASESLPISSHSHPSCRKHATHSDAYVDPLERTSCGVFGST